MGIVIDKEPLFRAKWFVSIAIRRGSEEALRYATYNFPKDWKERIEEYQDLVNFEFMRRGYANYNQRCLETVP